MADKAIIGGSALAHWWVKTKDEGRRKTLCGAFDSEPQENLHPVRDAPLCRRCHKLAPVGFDAPLGKNHAP